MEDIYFRCPTGVYIVDDSLLKIGEIIKKEGFTKVYLLYGNHLKENGELEQIIQSLIASGIEFEAQGGIKANPDIEFVRACIVEVKEYAPQAILACGGGSVIDTAKSVANAYYYEGDPLDFNKKTAIPKKALPVACLLTIAAAGSEMSDSCVISDYKTGFKGGFNSPTNRPQFTIMDAALTLEVSPFQTFCGIADIISHSFERYFSPSVTDQLSDYLALAAIRECIDLTAVLKQNLKDIEARRQLMLVSSFSHNGWTSFGKSKTRFPCHMVEHEMSGKYPALPHGLGLRFLMPKFLHLNEETLGEKIKKFNHFVFDVNDSSFIHLENFFDNTPLPKDLSEYGISKEELINYQKKLLLK